MYTKQEPKMSRDAVSPQQNYFSTGLFDEMKSKIAVDYLILQL